MDKPNKIFHCEDCEYFEDEEVPANCKKGHGKIAFLRRICTDFIIKKNKENQKEG